MLILLLLALLGGGGNWLMNPNLPDRDFEELGEYEVDLEMAFAFGDSLLWVDARGEEAFGKGHIPNAVNLSLDKYDEMLGGFLDLWQPDHRVVVYCDSSSCGASRDLANRLREDLGESEIYVLKGGWMLWISSQK